MFYILLPKKFLVPPVRMFLYNLKVYQSSASGPSHIMRGCSKRHLVTLNPTSWSIKEVSM